jgi:REP element-mobilizing transposase RayT
MSEDTVKRPLNPELIVDPRTVPFSEPFYRGVLPHLEKPGCTYFVTFSLADVAPVRAEQRRRLNEAEDALQLVDATDPFPTTGECIFRNSELAGIVEDSLLFFQGERYALSAWCVMPNHVHVVVTPFAGHTLSRVLQSWKSFSGRRINQTLERTGAVWQRESFDHIIRNEEHFERFVRYVEQNPVATGLVSRAEDWRFSSARFRGDL